MALGTVIWYDPAKGYGFIAPEDGCGDVFVHFSAVAAAQLETLLSGQKVGFDVEIRQGGRTAVRLSA